MTVVRSLIWTWLLVMDIKAGFGGYDYVDESYLRTKRAQELPPGAPYLSAGGLCPRCGPAHKLAADSARWLRHNIDLNDLYRDIRSITQDELAFLQNPILNRPLFLTNPLYQLLNSLDFNAFNYQDKHLREIEKPRLNIRNYLKGLRQKLKNRKKSEEVSTELPIRRKIRSTGSVSSPAVTEASLRPLSPLAGETPPPATTAPIFLVEFNHLDKELSTTMATTSTAPYPQTTEKEVAKKSEEVISLRSATPASTIRRSAKKPTRNMTLQQFSTKSPLEQGSFLELIPAAQQTFAHVLDQFERKYYNATFGKLLSISPPDRRENGISFVESGLFLYAILTALESELDTEARSELEPALYPDLQISDKIKILRHVLDTLPTSSPVLKLHWSTRLLVNGTWSPTTSVLEDLHIQLERLNGTETPEMLAKFLNHKVEQDSGGAMRNTFEEDELSEGAHAVLLNTLYVRARWRAAPTLLNGTRLFRDAPGAPLRTARMIRVNDVMRYADLPEWDAEAVDISYATPGLSLLLVVPRGNSLRHVAEMTTSVSLGAVTARMRSLRIAATLPIYTLRMTLLLPNKLEAMGICRLVDTVNATDIAALRLSHAVQRLMFWAEAGRNAFKDDGIEWDDPPEFEMVVDRPYLFYVRWRNVTIMNGNFVL